MEPISSAQETQIINSLTRVFKTGNIDKLTKAAYNFLYLSSGFIAHYNIHGFRDEYRSVNDLRWNIIRNADANQWSNFSPGERDYDYYMSKARIYKQLVKMAHLS
jgi:hypothetical protein